MKKRSLILIVLILVGVLLAVAGCQTDGDEPPTPTSAVTEGQTDANEPLTPTSAVTCSALAIYMEHPYPGEKGVNYIKVPIIITGYVSSPEAMVTVNGVEAKVDRDGTYSAMIQLKEDSNSIQAIAKLGAKTDEITYLVGVSTDGTMYVIPGLGGGGPRYQSRVLYEHSVELKAGETKLIYLTLEVKKDIRGPEQFTYTISGTSGEYSEDRPLMPEGLEVNIEPSQFIVCPNTTYYSILTIKTTADVTARDYRFLLECYLENGFRGNSSIRISVTP